MALNKYLGRRAGCWVVRWGSMCKLATDTEVEFWEEIERLRDQVSELEEVLDRVADAIEAGCSPSPNISCLPDRIRQAGREARAALPPKDPHDHRINPPRCGSLPDD